MVLTWQQTRKMKSVMAVHNTFSLNWICWNITLSLGERDTAMQNNVFHKMSVIHTFLSGFWISGSTAQNGFITSKNLTENKHKFDLVGNVNMIQLLSKKSYVTHFIPFMAWMFTTMWQRVLCQQDLVSLTWTPMKRRTGLGCRQKYQVTALFSKQWVVKWVKWGLALS